MKTTTLLPLLSLITALPLAAQVSTLQIPFTPPGSQVAALGAQISAAQQASRTAALQWAAQRGLAAQGQGWALTGLTNGVPEYTGSDNSAAAATVGADVLAIVPGLDGSGVRIGLWEWGAALAGHRELPNLNWLEPNSPLSLQNHANHVAGTLGAQGVNPLARGMAPGASILGWDALNDLAEMTANAGAGNGQAVTISNHSYSQLKGWRNYPQNRGVRGPSGNFGWHWSGTGFAGGECFEFGQYGDDAQYMDSLCALVPGYLPFRSAGNERSDGPPAAGAVFWVVQGGQWTPLNYDADDHPRGDGAEGHGVGWDTMSSEGCAKNVIAVGAYEPATQAMATFSSYGPSDDGRIKPDLVAPGVGLFSSFAGGVNAYGVMSGTSMATPTAAGTAALLQELAAQRFGNQLRADTLKALLLHTADDLFMKGPDYLSGFGLLNAVRARDLIQTQADFPRSQVLVNDVLAQGSTRVFHLIVPSGAPELRATLCWIDPAGTVQNALDSAARSLVNDLDIQINGPVTDGPVMRFTRPFAPDPANPTQATPRGRNSRDNVEQVLLENPAPGSYTVVVSHTGPLTAPLGGNSQRFALVMSGQQTVNALDFWPALTEPVRLTQLPTAPLGFADIQLTNRSSSTKDLAILANAVADGISARFIKTDPLLNPGVQWQLRVEVTATGAQYPAGVYQRQVRLRDNATNVEQVIPVIVEIPALTPAVTQQFPGAHDAAFDLSGSQLVLVPLGNGTPADPHRFDRYFRRLGAHECGLPYSPAGGQALQFPAPEQAVEIPRAPEAPFNFYGVDYDRMFVSPNGCVTFGAADAAPAFTLAAHFSLPRISAFFRDLDPASGGSVRYWRRGLSHVIVWEYVPVPGGSEAHRVQMEVTDIGVIRITWEQVGTASGIVGVSAGTGFPAPFVEANFSAATAFDEVPRGEYFSARNAVDIQNAQLIYEPVPDLPGSYRSYFQAGVFTLPVDDATAAPLTVPPGQFGVDRTLAAPVPLFGRFHAAAYISLRGFVGFSDTSGPIATLYPYSLQANWTRLTHRSLPGREVFTWKGSPAPGGEAHAVQAEIYTDGRIRITWLGLPAEGVVNLVQHSPQPLAFQGFFSDDLTHCPAPPLPEVNVFVISGQVAEMDGPAGGARLLFTRTGFTDQPLITALALAPESTATAADFLGPIAPVTIPAGNSMAMAWPFLPPNPDTEPEGPELAVLRFITMGTVVNGPHNEARITILDRPVQDWMHRHGFQTIPLTADTDRDGLSNLEEYAAGTDPRVPNQRDVQQQFQSQTSGAQRLTLSMPLNPSATDLEAFLQTSTNLTQWTDGPLLAFPAAGGLHASASATAPSGARRFYGRISFRLLP